MMMREEEVRPDVGRTMFYRQFQVVHCVGCFSVAETPSGHQQFMVRWRKVQPLRVVIQSCLVLTQMLMTEAQQYTSHGVHRDVNAILITLAQSVFRQFENRDETLE